MLADRGDLERMISDFSGSDVANNGPAEISDADRFNGHVTRIVDGDTFWISGQGVRIRIWALDAPETATPGGAAATAELARLTSDHELNCRQRDIDRYGRIVGQCFLPDGRDITAAMIESGKATEYCSFSKNHYGTC
jgi:endonuclease YncB( thermonuclease family)